MFYLDWSWSLVSAYDEFLGHAKGQPWALNIVWYDCVNDQYKLKCVNDSRHDSTRAKVTKNTICMILAIVRSCEVDAVQCMQLRSIISATEEKVYLV